MEQFLGLSRDASREKSEAGTSPYSRNIVLDKKLGSISQENGFIYRDSIRGITIGVFSTNTHIIYITYLIDTGNTLISYVDTTTDIITEVVDTQYFKYSVERPIEIVAWYNYNQELLIMFSDGVFEQSSAPRLINLMDIGVELDGTKEFLSQKDADTTLLFSNISIPRYSIKYGGKSIHDADLLFFTIAYVLPDGITTTKFIPTLAEAFPLYAFGSEYKKEITFKIEDLDLFFNQIVIGIIAYKDNALFGYITDPINITTTTYEYIFNSTLSLNSVSVDSIVVESSIFEKVKSLTIGNDAIILGGISTRKSSEYQKYACNLKLNLYFDERKDNRHQAPLLCPDEVYFMTIALAFNNGTFSEELHIPNQDPNPIELDLLDKSYYGLNDISNNNLQNFHVINTGDWDDPSIGLPNFNNLSEVKLNWGYWQNEEVYPDNENYNGTIDYDGTTVLLDGRDLRGTNVKLHRVPGLDNLCKKFPMRLGMDIKNEEGVIERDLHTRMPAFSINVENFIDAFSTVITRDNIIGYRLSFVKKESGNKIVEDINFIKPLVAFSSIISGEVINPAIDGQLDEHNDYAHVPNVDKYSKYYQFGFSKIKSINLSIYKGSIGARIVKANYGLFTKGIEIDYNEVIDPFYRNLENDSDTKGTLGQYTIDNLPVIPDPLPYNVLTFKIPSKTVTYATIQSIEQTAGNIKNSNNFALHEQIKLKSKNSNITYPPSITPVPIYGWNPLNYIITGINDTTSTVDLNFYDPSINNYTIKTVTTDDIKKISLSSTLLNIYYNIHQGLQPKSFVVIGMTNLDNPTLLFKDFGDTFSNNIYNEIQDHNGVGTILGAELRFISYYQQIYSGLLSITNNSLVYFVKDKKLDKVYYIYSRPGFTPETLTFNYSTQIATKESTRQLNTLIANVAFNARKKYINDFPFRIVKSLSIQSENLSTTNVRTFLANAYYDMPSMRGEVIYVVGFDKGVYCQQRYSLSIFQLKEKLNNNDENSAYLAEADLFAYKPQVVVDEDNKGYVGSVHQFGKKLSKDGLITIDAERGKIWIIAGQTPKELSKIKMSNEFNRLLEDCINIKVPTLFNPTAPQDNPYNGNGVLVGIDDKTNRILVTIINYESVEILPEGVEFINGIPYDEEGELLDIKNPLYTINKSKTFSFNLDWGRWVAEHDYIPQFYVNTNKRNYAGINNINLISTPEDNNTTFTYITNIDQAKSGMYFFGFDNTIHESYIDLLFNSRYDLSKLYKSILWRSTVKDKKGNSIYNKTINAIILYTDYQCSGRIELDTETFNLIRNSEGTWNFNDFRDLVVSSDESPIMEDGSYDVTKIYNNRNWFEKSDIINNFIIVRLIMNNIENTQTHIHQVNVEVRVSDRI